MTDQCKRPGHPESLTVAREKEASPNLPSVSLPQDSQYDEEDCDNDDGVQNNYHGYSPWRDLAIHLVICRCYRWFTIVNDSFKLCMCV